MANSGSEDTDAADEPTALSTLEEVIGLLLQAVPVNQEWVRLLIEKISNLLTQVKSTIQAESGSPTHDTLQSIMAAYLALFVLRGGAMVEDEFASIIVRIASRFLRDVLSLYTLGLMQWPLQQEEFLELLDEASGGRVSEKSDEGENLRASLLKSIWHVYGPLDNKNPSKQRRRRISRVRKVLMAQAARDRAKLMRELEQAAAAAMLHANRAVLLAEALERSQQQQPQQSPSNQAAESAAAFSSWEADLNLRALLFY